MTESTVAFEDLHISLPDMHEAMGYDNTLSDEDLEKETLEVLNRAAGITRPRFSFFITHGNLNVEKDLLTIGDTDFRIGHIIARQLRGSEAFAFFTATAGREFEAFQQQLQQEDDIVKIYLADSLGSVIAERTADQMEFALDKVIGHAGHVNYDMSSSWRRTNRFSPGYCGWHVNEQQTLFSLFPAPEPCGIRLTDSSLMLPIKSVSGVIGLGTSVRRLEYTCGLCTFEQCYRRKQKG